MKKLLVFVGLFALLAPIWAQAAVFEGGEAYTFPSSRSMAENLYAGGGNANFMGSVAGDLFFAAGTLNFSGNVGQDLFAAGGNVNLSGRIGQDLRTAGGNLNISSIVGGELLAAGGQVYFDRSAQVARGARLAGGNINIAGTINGNVSINGGTIQIDGRINGDVDVKASQKLIIGDGAFIAGVLNYKAPQEATISQGAQITGGINYGKYQPIQKHGAKKGFLGFLFAWSLVKLAMSIVAALVIYLLTKKRMEEAVKYVLTNFSKETLRGFILSVVFPIAVIISFITVIGVWLGMLGLLFYLFMLLFASIFSIALVGS
ncbi:MAG: polymer-forming cytoskeletal protein, partial [Candidatus Portnoybacteria bacterium]|nr:polymer-forming cytoskeletal protein [Candidatus Portnoybacteria bacterium]